MPTETMRVSFKPSNFFAKNPALDVPTSEQSFNQSVLASQAHHQGTAEAKVGADGKTCRAGEP